MLITFIWTHKWNWKRLNVDCSWNIPFCCFAASKLTCQLDNISSLAVSLLVSVVWGLENSFKQSWIIRNMFVQIPFQKLTLACSLTPLVCGLRLFLLGRQGGAAENILTENQTREIFLSYVSNNCLKTWCCHSKVDLWPFGYFGYIISSCLMFVWNSVRMNVWILEIHQFIFESTKKFPHRVTVR